MITLLGSVLGFATSFLPKILGYFEQRQNNAHELKMLEATAEIQKDRAIIDAQIRDLEAVRVHDSQLRSGYKWMDAYRSSVRPTITYMFMALFIFVEMSAYIIMLKTGMDAFEAGKHLWNAEINGLFAAIISFWFSDRGFSKK